MKSTSKRNKTPRFKSSQDEAQTVMLGDVTTRLGSLESQINDILPVLGKVAESVSSVNGTLNDLKSDVRGMNESFIAFRLQTADYGSRISSLEGCNKEKKDKKNKLLGAAAAALGSLLVAVLVYMLGLK